ncbi:MAG TPA: alpha-L-fucosidase [Bacteroidales bacterium]|nr:alpha-L-fucosidase [Bacteroidales bacterium]
MLRNLFIALCLLTSLAVKGQTYSASWESLDKRPVPAWFEDSKFGIFIHWGVYSVPAWGPTGDSIGVYDKYSEWYWNKLTNQGSKVNKYFKQFHNSTYGPTFKYQDFAPMFKAELFDPDKWAQVFKESGAKYIVLTSKHHEGFTLWPSAQSWNWNSVDVGPHRDLCGELTASVKRAGLHMGFYYSLYEWYNPTYRSELNSYVDNHMIPQMKDLVTRYTPDILWTDGEWDKPSSGWKSEQFLAWLYNESPVKENIVVNDRWGKETRSKHGGIYTTEYGLIGEKEGIDNSVPHPWEECRGIGTSFGFNRTEGLSDYSTAEQLVKLLVSTVSAGGNLLLDIGPDADGTIPVIMQQRLLEMGEWLKVNGDAIYGTRAFIRTKKEEGINTEANKTIFFTMKGGNVYVICTEWPKNGITLNNVKTSGQVKATLLGSGKPASVKTSGGSVMLTPPALTPDDHQLAYVFKVSGIVR